MEKILINWLELYTGVNGITAETKFTDLNFDLFDEAQTVKFIRDNFNLDVNKEIWYITIMDLINDVA